MKLAKSIIASLILLACGGGGHNLLTLNAQEITSPVVSDRIECDKAVLSHKEGAFVARFQVQGIPHYNNYGGSIGNRSLDSSNTDLRTVHGQLASWLIVVDVSDPKGRAKTIQSSAGVAARLVSLMSQECNVRILAMAGSQQVVAEADQQTSDLRPIMTEGQLNHTPIMEASKQGIQFGHPVFQSVVGSLMASEGVQMDNTYLWIGLSRALKEQMPSCSSGEYQNMPRGVILISDGVDESRESSENLKNLIDTANKLDIPIHTIAFPFKDSSRNATERHKGFDALQKLANDTNGGFLNYAADIGDPNHPVCIAKMEALLRRTSASVLQLVTPIEQLPAVSTLRVILRDGVQGVGSLTVPQEKVGTVVADNALHQLFAKRQAVLSNPQEGAVQINEMQQLFAEYILPHRKYEELFMTTQVNADFAIRVQQILEHIDKYDALRSSGNITNEVVACMLDYKRALPEPPQPENHVTAHVHTSPSAGTPDVTDEYESDTFKSWVWWTLGVGGSCFFVVIFLLIIRALTRSDNYEATPATPEETPSAASTVLASLVDVNNPGRCWDVCKASVTVGRGTAADIHLPSDHVSSLHFTLSCDAAGQWSIKDANSTNGTSVNGTRITTVTPINNGDTITLADMQLAFRLR